MSIERYSYQNIKKAMKDNLLEYLNELSINRHMLETLDENIYRNTILERMKKKDENIAHIYNNRKWVDVFSTPYGVSVNIDGYLEDMLKEIMNDIDAENSEYIEIFRDWESKNPLFHMSSVYAEEYVTDEEYDKIVVKCKEKIKQMADAEGVTPFTIKRRLPPFDSAYDMLEWLEDHMNPEDIDECLKNPEEETEECGEGCACKRFDINKP